MFNGHIAYTLEVNGRGNPCKYFGFGEAQEAGLRCGSGEAPQPQEECQGKACFSYYLLEFKGWACGFGRTYFRDS